MTVGELIAELEKYDKNYDVTYGCPADSIKVANEWADDTHTLGLTKKGMKLYLKKRRYCQYLLLLNLSIFNLSLDSIILNKA